MNKRVAIVGCGVVGAAIAYELSQIPGLEITVFDRQTPAQAATGAALGILIGGISQKIKGNAWWMRETSIRCYDVWIPQLQAQTRLTIPYNRRGILKLIPQGEDLVAWESLRQVRQSQGWRLEVLGIDELRSRYPQVNSNDLIGAVYSPQDRQVDPTALTLALVAAATQNGVTFQLNTPVTNVARTEGDRVQQIQTPQGVQAIDWLVIAAGLGSTPLTQSLASAIEIRPVLGQAIHLRLPESLGSHPVITGNDVHIAPIMKPDLTATEYWIGATVEFPVNGEITPAAADLERVRQQAIAFCPALAAGEVVRTWSGLRPRPHNRPAPIVEFLTGYQNVLLATGHYRNGVLLAPATAQKIRMLMLGTNL